MVMVMVMVMMVMMMMMMMMIVSAEQRPGWTIHMFDHTTRISSDKNM